LLLPLVLLLLLHGLDPSSNLTMPGKRLGLSVAATSGLQQGT
jgi:hypothetical protein